jgi:hypothetical protein
MARPNPIEYAERLYAAIRAANFSPIAFLSFGNAVKDGVELRRIPRIAAEPFMRVVGEMLYLEGPGPDASIIDAPTIDAPPASGVSAQTSAMPPSGPTGSPPQAFAEIGAASGTSGPSCEGSVPKTDEG